MRALRSINLMLFLAAVVATGCGGGGSSSEPSVRSEEPSSVPVATPSADQSPRPAAPFQVGPLPKSFRSIGEMPIDIALSGPYRTSSFLPPFSFNGPDLAYPFHGNVDAPDLAIVSSGSPEGGIIFVRPNGVYQGGRIIDVPSDLVAWLRGNPYLRVGPATPVSIGGLHGSQMDALVTGVPAGESPCGSDGPCLQVASTFGDFTAYLKGTKIRFAVLDAGGHQLLVSVDSTVRDFPQFSANADRLLRSVRFVGV